MTTSQNAYRKIREEFDRLKKENQVLRTRLIQLRRAIRALNHLESQLNQISTDSDPFKLLNDIMYYTLRAVNSKNGSLLLLDSESNELVFAEVIGPNQEELIGNHIPSNKGIVGKVLETQKPMLVPDVRKEALWSPNIDEEIGFQTNTLMCVPLTAQDTPLGVLEVVNTNSGEPFDEDDLEILLLVGHLAAEAILKAEETASA